MELAIAGLVVLLISIVYQYEVELRDSRELAEKWRNLYNKVVTQEEIANYKNVGEQVILRCALTESRNLNEELNDEIDESSAGRVEYCSVVGGGKR